MSNQIILSKVQIYNQNTKCDIIIDNGTIKQIIPHNSPKTRRVQIPCESAEILSPSISYKSAQSAKIIDCTNITLFPGFVDVHVHLREPGFLYKATIKSETIAAANGGYTTVCSMPNTNPAPDSLDHLKLQQDIIKNTALINVLPYGAITKGRTGKELSNMRELSPYVVAFSDDGSGVQNDDLMYKAMTEAKANNKIIAAHCEDETLLFGGYIHDGEYARTHNHKGISSKSEWAQIQRDLQLVRKSGVSYHVCHISTAESVNLIRKAKREGLDVSAETAPHYLILTDDDLREDGFFKMNPPLRSEADREALIEGILDGTISIIATDHAPHSIEEKSKGLAHSAMGIVGLETAFPLLYTNLVKKGIITLDRLISLMSTSPAARFGIECAIKEGAVANLCGFDLKEEFVVRGERFMSAGRASPFIGQALNTTHKFTIYNGQLVCDKTSSCNYVSCLR